MVVGPIPVATPLPDVSCHIVKSVTVRWKLRDWREAGETIIARVLYRKLSLVSVRHPFTPGFQFIAPGTRFAVQCAARGEFSFGDRSHLLAGQLRVSSGM